MNHKCRQPKTHHFIPVSTESLCVSRRDESEIKPQRGMDATSRKKLVHENISQRRRCKDHGGQRQGFSQFYSSLDLFHQFPGFSCCLNPALIMWAGLDITTNVPSQWKCLICALLKQSAIGDHHKLRLISEEGSTGRLEDGRNFDLWASSGIRW